MTVSKAEAATDPMELVGRLEGEAGDCPFCGHDPYHYVDNGVGMERVAVVCCDEGVALFQHGDPVLTEQISLRREAAACIREMVEWRPIETAPRDGTEVMLRTRDGLLSCSWDWTQNEWSSSWLGIVLLPDDPTHWLPLPPAPGAEA